MICIFYFSSFFVFSLFFDVFFNFLIFSSFFIFVFHSSMFFFFVLFFFKKFFIHFLFRHFSIFPVFQALDGGAVPIFSEVKLINESLRTLFRSDSSRLDPTEMCNMSSQGACHV